ncbi:tetratricopeptide repeat protein [Actinomadura namibiensis]|uniref:tetratricopeptide repeat protein n=1 Tax=Actinomadura kijaniata TaxID=46161 RepID=UPI00361F7C6C
MTDDQDWERRVAALWDAFDDHEPVGFVARMAELAAERPGDALAEYELASALDSTGDEARAAEHYERAFAAGLPACLRRPATIQYASTLRNLGRFEESVALLTAERDAGSDELDGAVAAFLALALTSAGRERQAVGVALGALAPHLPRYRRSLANYARELL